MQSIMNQLSSYMGDYVMSANSSLRLTIETNNVLKAFNYIYDNSVNFYFKDYEGAILMLCNAEFDHYIALAKMQKKYNLSDEELEHLDLLLIKAEKGFFENTIERMQRMVKGYARAVESSFEDADTFIRNFK